MSTCFVSQFLADCILAYFCCSTKCECVLFGLQFGFNWIKVEYSVQPCCPVFYRIYVVLPIFWAEMCKWRCPLRRQLCAVMPVRNSWMLYIRNGVENMSFFVTAEQIDWVIALQWAEFCVWDLEKLTACVWSRLHFCLPRLNCADAGESYLVSNYEQSFSMMQPCNSLL